MKSILFALAVCIIFFTLRATCLSQVLMKDGRMIRGIPSRLALVNETPADAERLADKSRHIVLVEDGLRRIYVSRFEVADFVGADVEESPERFRFKRQPSEITREGRKLLSVRSYYDYEPFDEFGRRIMILEGKTPIEQAITEINPRYVSIGSRGIHWNMRIATNSLPQETISRILLKQIELKNLEDRKRIVRFYLQGERYHDARNELDSLLKEFGESEQVLRELQPLQRNLGQLETEQIRKELELRRKAGQYEYIKPFLAEFPAEQATVETLQAVRNMIEEDAATTEQCRKIAVAFQEYAEKVSDEKQKTTLLPILEEIAKELNNNTLERMAPLQLVINDNETPVEEKLAVGTSGWLVGANDAVTELPLAVSMATVRNRLGEYLRETGEKEREMVFAEIVAEEAGTIETVAKILKGMKPVFPIPQKPLKEKPGSYLLTTTAYDDHLPFAYWIQLPPEYDPNRRYPMIITLNGETSPEQQTDWWAGDWRNQQRYGQATRFGYIVMSPVWNIDNLPEYDFSARSHAAVLYSYYDSLRHFSIDVDRVFLTGHSFGGDAAWDIGISHPDLWAGVMPIAATGRKYIQAYAANARLVPLYFVNGDVDGMVGLDDNIAAFNTYLTARTMSHYNCTVVSYIGRGHEGFSDEIQYLFDWMGRQTRQFPRKEFDVRSLRAWDNFFWWCEGERLPPRSTLEPLLWSPDGPPPGYRTTTIKGNITSQNSIRLTFSAGKITVWLSPELIDFNARAEILLNNRRTNALKGVPQGNLYDMLEDVRTRFDRQHPFWLKVGL
ncbi:MAG: hypothetical protein LBJ67_11455 [Planctomycetaceae bacterium]|jgi:pimeloyl-ACP methyl ester carboxylesterase|nr:hypothetical protein [Planctomycetaceae bacterium]